MSTDDCEHSWDGDGKCARCGKTAEEVGLGLFSDVFGGWWV